MSDTPEMAKRIGTLFVLAMQTNDAELREAAHLDKSELGMQDGPIFLPVATLLNQRDALVKALEDCPLPSQSAPTGEFYGRFYAWYNGQRESALKVKE